MNINEPIGKYFKLKHLIWSNTAKNKNINNMPGIDGNPSQTVIIKNLKNLMEICVDPIVDIKVPNLNSADLYNFIYYNISGWDQLIWEYPEKGNRSWIHVSYSSRNRRKTTLASDVTTYHNLFGGIRRGSKSQYQDGISNAKIV